jgi:hypothetical protein
MRQLTEMLLKNRPVVDPLKNQGFGIVTPHQHDILSGRGNGANQHPGNVFFRHLIHKYKHHYIHTGPSEKKLITKKIVEEVQQRNPPGRFLKQSNETELWDCLDIDKVLKKTGQALREKAPELKKRAREEQKTRVTLSSESYFQNSRPSVGSAPSSYITTQFDCSDVPISAQKAPMAFSMQPDVLNALAYQNIPLATTSGGKTGVGVPMSIVGSSGVVPRSGIGNVNRNDSFNLTRLAAVTNQIVDPAHQKKAEELIAKVTSPGASLSNIYHYFRQNASALSKNLPLQQQLIKQEVQVPVSAAAAAGSETPHAHDVLFSCDGAIVASHPGSKFFFEQIHQLLPQFKGAAVSEKRIEQKIIAAIGDRWPPGRFLGNTAMNRNYNNWQVLSFNQALQATSAHLQRACFESQRIVIPNLHDVLVVRGNSQHQGNIYFRTLIEKYCKSNECILMPSSGTAASPSNQQQSNANNVMTSASQMSARKRIAKQIVQEVERVGGRFLKFNSSGSYWEPLDLETTLSKALQGMRDYQKKKEIHQKPVKKQVGVVIPVLKCVKESVVPVNTNNSRNGDPPGVFFNYYSPSRNNQNQSLAISENGRDPPGQVPSVIPRRTKPKPVTTAASTVIRHKPEPKRPDSLGQDQNLSYLSHNNASSYNSNLNGIRLVSENPPNGKEFDVQHNNVSLYNSNPNEMRIVSDDDPPIKKELGDTRTVGLQNFFQNQNKAEQSNAIHNKRKLLQDGNDNNISYSNSKPVEKRRKLLEP